MLQKSLWFNALQKYMRQHTVLLKEDQNSFTLLGLRSEIAFYPLKAFNVFHHKVVVFIICGCPDRDSFSFFFSFSLFPPKPKYLFWRHQRVVVLSCELSFPGVCCQGVWRGKYLPVLWWLSNHACIRPQLEAGCLYSSGCNADIYMLRSFKKQYAAEHLKTTYIYIFFPTGRPAEGITSGSMWASCPSVLWFWFMGCLRNIPAIENCVTWNLVSSGCMTKMPGAWIIFNVLIAGVDAVCILND